MRPPLAAAEEPRRGDISKLQKMVCNWSKSGLLVFSTFLIVSPNEDSDPVGLILREVVDQFAADLGPQDRRDPPDFWHLWVK